VGGWRTCDKGIAPDLSTASHRAGLGSDLLADLVLRVHSARHPDGSLDQRAEYVMIDVAQAF
jgi:hypothetical protein